MNTMKAKLKAFIVWGVALLIIALSIANLIVTIKNNEQRAETKLRIERLEKIIEVRPTVIHGINGIDGEPGISSNGEDGKDGKSAYQSATDNGFIGTEKEWVDSLQGKTGNTPAAPDIICNVLKNRWEIKYDGDTNYKVLNGIPTPCTIINLLGL